jgi:hypothetical protein
MTMRTNTLAAVLQQDLLRDEAPKPETPLCFTGGRPMLGTPQLQVAVGTLIAERPPQSGRVEARTGLRMMPTFPRPSLSFRTAGFPRYGWKAGNVGQHLPIIDWLKRCGRLAYDHRTNSP